MTRGSEISGRHTVVIKSLILLVFRSVLLPALP